MHPSKGEGPAPRGIRPLRCFLAIEVPTALQRTIHVALEDGQRRWPTGLVRWVPEHNVHLTMKFLGDTNTSRLKALQASLQAELTRQAAFTLELEGFGVFPNLARPHVLWIGVSAPRALTALQHRVESVTTRLGYPPEDRDFAPHLTVGRVRPHLSSHSVQQLRDVLEHVSVGSLGQWKVTTLGLFQSELSHSGAVYTRLGAVPLLDT